MKPCYEIKDWSMHFEKSQSRTYKRISWVPIQNKHDGKGFRRLSRHKDAVEVFAAFVLMVQVASKCPNRGILADTDGPLDAIDLADATGFPEEIFKKAFKVLISPEIGWIIEVLHE